MAMVKDALALTQDLEALKASVDQYQQAVSDIEGRKKALREDEWQVSRTLRALREERERQLKTVLDEKGLGICAWGRHPKSDRGYSYGGFRGAPHTDKEDGDELRTEGVFPLSEMSMYYRRRVHMSELPDDDDIEVAAEFALLCPSHARNVTDSYSRKSSYSYGSHNYGNDIESTFALKDGRFIREVDGQAVKTEPQTGVPSEKVYELFGFPRLLQER